MSDFPYTCAWATKSLADIAGLLGEAGLLQSQPDRGLLNQCIRSCSPCRKKKGPKRCLGWNLVLERDLIILGPVSQSGHAPARINVSALCSFQREVPARREGWESAPMAKSQVVAEIFDIESDALLERHHVDLANRKQPGPTWHYQYGGNPTGGVPVLPTSWLSEPRWPFAPMELVLLLELLVSSFFPTTWDSLNEDGRWVRLMMETEQLVMHRHFDLMRSHFGRPLAVRDRTWLTALDNSAYDPRPT
jgi:hypothetical protein